MPFCRSASVKRFLRRNVARAMPSGGVMPAAMTAAMIFSSTGLPEDVATVARPVVANV